MKVSKLEKYLRSVKQDKGRGRAREMVRLRFNHKCVDCEIRVLTSDVVKHNSKQKTLKGRIKSLDIHHTKACGKKSRKYDRVNNLKDMVSLCHRCHYNRPEHKVKSTSFAKAVSKGHANRNLTTK